MAVAENKVTNQPSSICLLYFVYAIKTGSRMWFQVRMRVKCATWIVALEADECV